MSPSPRRLGAWFLYVWLQGLAGLSKSCGLIWQGLGSGGTGKRSYFALPVMHLQHASVSPFLYTADVQPTSPRRTHSPPGNPNSKPPPKNPTHLPQKPSTHPDTT